MSVLSDYNLVLPQIPSHEEWIEYIESVEGQERDISILRAKGYNLLADFNETSATYESLGWLSLWAKVMAALESIIPALHSGSNLILQSLSRATFEWMQHQLAITDPIHDLIQNMQINKQVIMSDYLYRSVIDRLRGYAAWCLWSDRKFYQELIHPHTQNDIWDSKPAREILDDGEKLRRYEELYGPLNSETDEKILRQGRTKMERKYREKIRRIDQWLGDTKIEHWCKKLLEMKRNGKPLTLFGLFGDDNTIRKRLPKHGLKFAYTNYSESSMALHGSSIEQFMFIDDSSIAPKIQVDNQVEENLLETVIFNCNHMIVALAMIDQYILRKSELRK